MYEHLTTPCIEMTQKPDPKGYGRTAVKRYGKVVRRVHVLAWVDANGRLPNPETPCILHHCDNRACINPEHLYEGTQQDNIRDMVERRRFWQMQVTRCPSGHEYTEDNTIIDPRHGGRSCRACRSDRKRAKLVAAAETEGRAAGIACGKRTHCLYGHPFDEVNTIIRLDGSRKCRTCQLAYDREYQRERRRKAREARQNAA